MNQEDMRSMKLHEFFVVSEGLLVTRVVGGWIYESRANDGRVVVCSVFVPLVEVDAYLKFSV